MISLNVVAAENAFRESMKAVPLPGVGSAPHIFALALKAIRDNTGPEAPVAHLSRVTDKEEEETMSARSMNKIAEAKKITAAVEEYERCKKALVWFDPGHQIKLPVARGEGWPANAWHDISHAAQMTGSGNELQSIVTEAIELRIKNNLNALKIELQRLGVMSAQGEWL